jgi:hypothetical protein
MPQIIMMTTSSLDSTIPPQAPPGRQSSLSAPEGPTDLPNYIAWFKLREPLLGDSIGEYVAALNQERGYPQYLREYLPPRPGLLGTGLPAGLMARMKASVKTWRGPLAESIG